MHRPRVQLAQTIYTSRQRKQSLGRARCDRPKHRAEEWRVLSVSPNDARAGVAGTAGSARVPAAPEP